MRYPFIGMLTAVALCARLGAAAPETLESAKSMLDSGRVAEAELAARAFLASHAASADAHYLLGQILFRQQKARESLAEYTAAAKLRTPNAFDLKIVACDYVVLGAYADADKWFTKSIQANAQDAQTWYYLGRSKYNENRFEEAISAFHKCLELEPKNVKAEDNLGLSFEALGRANEAIAAYRDAIAWQGAVPSDAEPLFDLGSLLVEKDRSDEGIPWLLQALTLSPRAAKIHRQLGKAYLHLERLPQAQAEFESAVRIEPENAALHFMLGQAYRKSGQAEKATLEFDRCAELNRTKSAAEITTPAVR